MIRLYITDEQAKLLQEGLRLLTSKKESEYFKDGRKCDALLEDFMMIDALMEILDRLEVSE